MQPFELTLLISAILGVSLLVCWLDYKKGWHLAAWISGRIDNPFIPHNDERSKQESAEKDLLILQLTERIQVLEKIVTEPAFELNQKLNRL